MQELHSVGNPSDLEIYSCEIISERVGLSEQLNDPLQRPLRLLRQVKNGQRDGTSMEPVRRVPRAAALVPKDSARCSRVCRERAHGIASKCKIVDYCVLQRRIYCI